MKPLSIIQQKNKSNKQSSSFFTPSGEGTFFGTAPVQQKTNLPSTLNTPIQRKESIPQEELLAEGESSVQMKGKTYGGAAGVGEDTSDLIQRKMGEPLIPKQLKEADNQENKPESKSKDKSGMPTNVQAGMEKLFNASFAGVQIHQDSSKASQMGALAYTQGKDVHFAPGQFRPDTKKGRELIGHEYRHVQQQANGEVKANTKINGMPVNNEKRLEKDADDWGAKAGQMKLNQNEMSGFKPQSMAFNTGAGAGLSQMKSIANGGVIQAKMAGGTGGAGKASGGSGKKGGGKGGNGKTPSVDASQAYVKDLTSQAPVDFIKGMKTAGERVNDILSQEKQATEDVFPEVEQPTGLDAKTGGNIAEQTGEKVKDDGGVASEAPVAPTTEGNQTVAPPPVQEPVSPPTERPASTTTTIGDQTVDFSAGTPPTVDVTGDADPGQIETELSTETTNVDTNLTNANLETEADFGEKDVLPEVEELELMKPEVEIPAAPVVALEDLGEVPELDVDALAQFNADAKIEMDEKVNVEMAKNDAEVAKMQADAQMEWQKYDEELKVETDRVKAEQKTAKKTAEDEVAKHRTDWKAENDAVKTQFLEDAGSRRTEIEGQIDAQINQANLNVEAEFARAEGEAAEKAQTAENEATAAEQEGANKEPSFWERVGSAFSSALDWIKDQFNKIVDTLQQAVKVIIDLAKEAAQTIIDTARDAIIGFIESFGNFLKGLVNKALAAFPEIRDRFNQLIDSAVQLATDKVNQLADSLKTFVSALLDALGNAIIAIMEAYQAYYNLLFEALKLIVDVLFKILQGIWNMLQAIQRSPQYLFWDEMMKAIFGMNLTDPIPGIERTTAPGEVGETVDPNEALLKKQTLSESDIELDSVLGEDALSPEVIEELNTYEEGEYDFAGASDPLTIDEFRNGGEGEENADPDFANMSDDEKLDYYLDQMRGDMNTSEATPDGTGKALAEAEAQNQEIPDVAKVGPLTVGKRMKFYVSQLRIGVQKWWDDNKNWVIPTVVAAAIFAITVIIATKGAAIPVIIKGLLATLTVIFGAMLVAQLAPLLYEFFSKSFNGDIEGGAQSFAAAVAVGLSELILNVIFKGVGKLLKAAGKGVKAAARGLRSVVKGGSQFIRRVGNAVLKNGKIAFQNMRKGVTRGIKKLSEFRNRIASHFRASKIQIIIKGNDLVIQIKINPWKDILRIKLARRGRRNGQVNKLGGNYRLVNDESQFAKALLEQKSNFRLFRVDQTKLGGDFILVDMSNPIASLRKGFIVDLKQGATGIIRGGGGAGNQLSKADTILRSNGFDSRNFRKMTGNGGEILDELKKPMSEIFLDN